MKPILKLVDDIKTSKLATIVNIENLQVYTNHQGIHINLVFNL
jgi:hypothetical protein